VPFNNNVVGANPVTPVYPTVPSMNVKKPWYLIERNAATKSPKDANLQVILHPMPKIGSAQN